jgi:alkylation response protein AidB-like acyl-CoA dehydrogenase
LTLQAALTRASVEQAAVILDGGAGLSTAGAAISRAKVRASETALLVTRHSLQMHGGIGYTDEAEIGLFLRKAMVLAASFGSARVHRDRYARLTIDSAL